MRRWTIGGMIGFVALCGLGLAALHRPTPLAVQVAVSAVLTVLLIATLGAWLVRPAGPWIGFALFGWAYALLSLGPWCADRVAPALLTTRILDETWTRFRAPESPTYVSHEGPGYLAGPATGFRHDPDYRRYHLVGHCLAIVLHGVAGVLAAGVLARGTRARPGT